MKKIIILIVLTSMLVIFAGCGKFEMPAVRIVQDDYSLDAIDGEIICEYRVGPDSMWSEECVDSDVTFDKDRFLDLFHEYYQYDPYLGSKNPLEYEALKICIDKQPDEWQALRESEFNVRAVFGEDGEDYRSVTIYRYDGKLYLYVASNGEEEYFVELPEEMSAYWQTIIENVEANIQQ